MKPFFDLADDYKKHEKEIDTAIKRVLLSGNYILGREVEVFEKEFAAYLGNKYAVGVGSGTDAITLSLMALGIGKGDEVIVPNFTAYPTIVGIERSGATPSVVDVKNYSPGVRPFIDVKKIKLTRRTKAIVPVFLYGYFFGQENSVLREFAKKNGLKIVEDCAQASTKFVQGDCGAFSFYPTKNLGGYGDGGAIVTDNKNFRYKLLALRNYGQISKNVFKYKGMNSRLDEIQAAVLRVKLKYLQRYKLHLKVALDPTKRKDFPTHYPYTVTQQKAFSGQKKEKFPVSEYLSKNVVSIGNHLTK